MLSLVGPDDQWRFPVCLADVSPWLIQLKYFGKRAKDLSLAEAALLAGLPQSPSRYRPDRNPDAALGRQRVVLRSMFDKGWITKQQFADAASCPVEVCRLSVGSQETESCHGVGAWMRRSVPAARESVEADDASTPARSSVSTHDESADARPDMGPICPFPIRRAMHASFLALSRRPAGGRTTIDLDIQDQVQRLARDHLATLPEGTELAVVVIDVAASAIVAVLGSGDPADPVDGQVNGAVARRSPGSALKPFLYATAFEMERLNGDSIVYDIPISRGAWTPSNFDRTHTPQVTAAEALRRSLNVPAILVAEGIGLARCCGVLEAVGVRLPPNAQQRGGLALAVGGIDVSLLDLTNAYATLARGGIRRQPRLFVDESSEAVRALKPEVCAAISDILSSRKRPPAALREGSADNVPWFMWKTGTSSGRRDAWAVGHNYRYAIGVWAGRFRGTGRLEYVGAQAAEPVLGRLFSLASLRLDADPPAPEAIRVRKPLALPKEVAEDVRITTPGNDETFIACGETAVIRASANRDDGNLWFLNGKLEGTGPVQRLVLRPGVYELRCVGRRGSRSTVRFSVCPSS
ncbi:MAG TPA: penicillin-binding transpeptidase domain-containing protein [Sedimentisphaerales bacterium]|jgi:penicillin-binding protein 1C|nr:penicillin-binding transpeptidase domain-containing protein [Sedimentisphaerales bacterium]HNU29173.1 penicillin-binding transpeptidase domain-containing protein [Sedimentisphaerales bacterium]